VVVEPATADRWDDVAGAFGSRARKPDSCWCQRFLAKSDVSNQRALQTEIESAEVPPGLIAYLDGEPVGWTRVVLRSTLPGVLNNLALARVLSADPLAWWVTCFAIRQSARGHGVGGALLEAAADHAQRQGASCVEGHPVDVSQLKAAKVSGSALFTGTMTMFEKAGFHEIGRTYASRPVMRRDFS
jgi:GNAT superfamily N-acetyltransferase